MLNVQQSTTGIQGDVIVLWFPDVDCQQESWSLVLHVALKHIYYIPFLDSEVQPSVHPKFANLSHPAIPAAVESGLLRQAVSMNMYSLQKFFLGSLSEGA